MTLTHFAPNLKLTIVAGAAAGNVTVTGIKTTDYLISVLFVDFTDASETGSDLTSEFSITAANTINNTGGTASTGGFLIVAYWSADSRGGDLNRS